MPITCMKLQQELIKLYTLMYYCICCCDIRVVHTGTNYLLRTTASSYDEQSICMLVVLVAPDSVCKGYEKAGTVSQLAELWQMIIRTTETSICNLIAQCLGKNLTSQWLSTWQEWLLAVSEQKDGYDTEWEHLYPDKLDSDLWRHINPENNQLWNKSILHP
jgi:hypothetical protein